MIRLYAWFVLKLLLLYTEHGECTGATQYNSPVDSLPPEEVEQELACLLPRKPKVSWLGSQGA